VSPPGGVLAVADDVSGVVSVVAPCLVVVVLVVVLRVVLGSSVRERWRAHRMREPVSGEAYVVSVTEPPDDARTGFYAMQLVVRVVGMAPATVRHQGVARVSAWPEPGMTLPVTVDRADPTRLRVEWDRVPTTRQRAKEAAQRIAAAMGGEPVDPAAPGGWGRFTSNTVVVNGRTIDAGDHPGLREEILRLVGSGDVDGLHEDILAALRARGIDPGAEPEAARPAAEDPAHRLRRLAQLHAEGLIDDAEYQTRRRRIVDGL